MESSSNERRRFEMCNQSSGDGQTAEDAFNHFYVVEMVDCLANTRSLSPALSILKKLFPAHAKEIEYRFRNKERSSAVDCDIVDTYLVYVGGHDKSVQKLNACLAAVVHSCYSTGLYTNPVAMSRHLVEMGADVNASDCFGRTILHALIASVWPRRVEDDCLEMVKYLLAKGADPLIMDIEGNDVIVEACKHRRGDVIHLIHGASTPEQAAKVIDSLELFGARNVPCDKIGETLWDVKPWDPKYWYSLGEGIGAWLLANHLKQSNENDVLSEEDFRQMFPSIESMRLSAIDVLEKILGPEHEETCFRSLDCASFFHNLNDHRRWIGIFKNCFRQIFTSGVSSRTRNERLKRLMRHFIWIVRSCNNISAENLVDIAEYLRVVVETVANIRRNVNLEHEPLSQDEVGHLTRLISNIILLFCFLNCSTSEEVHFKHLLRRALHLNLRAEQGKTLLMDVVGLLDCRPNFERYMPHAVELLLECGADVNETDIFGNTILHCFAIDFWSQSRQETLDYPKEKKLVQLFVDYGLHTDARNCNGVELSFILRYYGIKFSRVKDLRCLAARVIRSNNIPYVGIIPKALYSFVEIH